MARFVRWECAENPKHRGWREMDEREGRCHICLGVTSWEHDAEDVGARHHIIRVCLTVDPAEDLDAAQPIAERIDFGGERDA